MPINNASHTELVNAALIELAKNGYSAWPNNTGATKTDSSGWIKFGKKGSGDIMCILSPYGTHCEFEAKTGKAIQRKSQNIHQTHIVEKNGGIYIIFRSVAELMGKVKMAERWNHERIIHNHSSLPIPVEFCQ